MKLLILSDSHGDFYTLKKAVSAYGKNADVIIHCGDATRNEPEWLQYNCANSSIVCVKGNCDMGSMLREIEFMNLNGVKIMITHGHLFNVKYGLLNLYYKAKENNCDIAFFGHTHNPTYQILDDVSLINPGACSGYEGSCAVVEIDEKRNILVNHIKIR